jgi:signal transduction histidine kinase
MERTKSFVDSQTFRLTMMYLAIIMTMSIIFSGIIYSLNVARLEHRIQPSNEKLWRDRPILRSTLNEYLMRHIQREKTELIMQILLFNVCVLVFGTLLSYVLARKSLEPIEEAMASKDQFISDASHELRTPLTALLLSNQVALRNKKLKLAEAKKVLEENVFDIKRLQLLANGLLTIMQQQTVTKKRVQYADIVHDARMSVEKMAQEKNIMLNNVTKNFSFSTDPDIINQILTIIFENAIKYSPEQSEVIISATKKQSSVIISVKDSGVGIAKKDLPRIFERFYRADTARTAQKTGGYGIGLSIARQKAEQLGGTITVESELKKGSTFHIELP